MTHAPTMLADRLPPHSLPAEQGVLACCLLNPNDALPECADRLATGPESFYDLRHQTLYKTILDLSSASKPVDVVSVVQSLMDSGQLNSVGGMAYLSEIQDSIPSAANLAYYLEVVSEKHTLRKILQVCAETIFKVHEKQGEATALVDEVEREILAIGEENAALGVELLQKDHVRAALECIQKRGAGQMTGVPTGFTSLDQVTGGWQPGDLIILAARPSVGKSAMAFQIASFVAGNGLGVGFFSLEMSACSLNQRAIGTHAKVNVRNSAWTEPEYARMGAAASKLARLPLYIDDTSGLRMAQIRARARRWKKRHKIGLLVIDYLTLIRPKNDRQSAQEAVAEISVETKALAKELGVPIVALAQLNRDVEKGRERKPQLSDLRQSGQIEQDADVVGFLYRAETDTDYDEKTIPVNLLIAKQRNGPLDDIPFLFHREQTRFEEVSKIED